MKFRLFSFACLGLIAATAPAATFLVPQEYAKIQEAIEVAHDGDEVVVAPGIYEERLSIHRKIVLRSTFDGSDWGVVENTVIRPRREHYGAPAILLSGEMPKTIRGFRITRGEMPPDPQALGIWGNANVEYCIIENQDNRPRNVMSGNGMGGGLYKCNGVIQNNIIRNNTAQIGSAMADCGGILRNNMIYGNTTTGGTFVVNHFAGDMYNNTFYVEKRAVGVVTGAITNSVFWRPKDSVEGLVGTGNVPDYCVMRNYTGPGEGNNNADPRFVDPENGDFRLQADSPCIDAGKAIEGLRADLKGVQRGLKGTGMSSGDGSRVDIGAFEYVPKPVGVWLPNGGPGEIRAGDDLAVAWEMDLNTAGSAILLRLYDGPDLVADLGAHWDPSGAATATVKLPRRLPARATYLVRGFSSWNPYLASDTPAFAIANTGTAVHPADWTAYK